MLNYFRGGPLDATAYETSTLIETPHHAGHIPIEEYKWTPEVIESEKTGRRARVWTHKALVADEAPSTEVAEAATSNNTQGEQVMSDLIERRKSLKLSRRAVAEEAGITEAQLYTIEKNGPRVTDEAKNNLVETLDRLEQKVAAEASESEAAADPS